ncbi:MAG: FtsX-like permease family protein [Thermodesulfobacteriota bacterium]
MGSPLNRQRKVIDFALSSLARRKAKNLALLAVYTLIVFVCASLIFFVQAMKREASLLLAGAPDMVVQRLLAGRHDLIPADYGQAIAAIPGVQAVTPRLWGYLYDPAYGANYTLMVPTDDPPAPGLVRVGPGVARIMGVGPGDLLPLRAMTRDSVLLDVEKTLAPETELVAADLILLAEDDFRKLFQFPAGRATDLAVTVANPNELVTVASKVAALYPDARPILRSEMERTYDALFDWRGGMMVVVLAAALVSFIIFAWDKAAGLSAEERREIGILKSIGWETGDVLLLKLWEGIAVSLTAFLLGVLLAYGHVFFFSASLFEHALKGWAVLYPRFRLVPEIDAYQLGVLFFLSVIPYTVATIIPSWLAATVDPDAAMRS